MKIDLSELSYDGKWYDYEAGDVIDGPKDDRVCLKIKPYPAGKSNMVIRDGDFVISGGEAKRMFLYSLEDWRGIVDANDQPLKCSEQAKEKIYDLTDSPIVGFVVSKCRTFNAEKEGLEKN